MPEGLECRDDEGIFAKLVSEGFLSLMGGPNFLKHGSWLVIQCGKAVEILAGEVGLLVIILDITVEVPNEDAISLTNGDYLAIVSWVEDDGAERVSVADEALEVIRNGLLSFIVPDLDHVVFSASKHISGVDRDVKSRDGSSMAVGNLSHEDSFVLDQAVESNLAIFSDHKQVSVVIGELEGLHDVVHLDVMLDQE